MSPAIRRGLIEDELIFGVQCGRISSADRFVALWYLRAGDWTLNHPGVSADLRAKVLRVSPTLSMMEREADAALTTKLQKEQHSGTTR